MKVKAEDIREYILGNCPTCKQERVLKLIQDRDAKWIIDGKLIGYEYTCTYCTTGIMAKIEHPSRLEVGV